MLSVQQLQLNARGQLVGSISGGGNGDLAGGAALLLLSLG